MRRMLKAGLAALAALAILATLGGCYKDPQNATISTPMIGSDGKVVKGDDGQPLVVTQTLPPEALYYQAQQAAATQPLASIKIPDGQDATLPGGTEISFRLPVQVKQYTPESVQLVREVKDLAPWAVTAWGYNQMAEVGKAGIAGAKSTTNTISTTGDGSGVNVTGGSGGITNTSSSTPTTTTATTTTTTTTGTEAVSGAGSTQ